MTSKILVVDDEKSHCIMLEAVLGEEGYDIEYAHDGTEGVELAEKKSFDLILLDVRMNKMGGVEALKKIKDIDKDIPVIMMTAYASVNTAVDSLKSGAYDYLTKPLDVEELKIIIKKALDHTKLKKENTYLKKRVEKKYGFSNIIGESRAMNELFENISLAAPTDATILITGKSGTGKELIANAVHENSERKNNPFIKVNCAALPETLLESELFGHEKGSFTGAHKAKKGFFAMADKGTIFLDEISEISKNVQVKLLRVLQEQEIQPVGGNHSLKVDIRVVAATNKNLEEEVKEGRFREDLYYRLNVLKLNIPELIERGEDIILLADYFLKKYAEKNGKEIKGFKENVYKILLNYNWPGNVRELENFVERTVILTPNEYIQEKDLPPYILYGNSGDIVTQTRLSGKTIKEMEKEMILRTLEETDGNRTRTAEILGISRRKLQIKLKEYGVNR
ncbi:MAG: sigma-54-dependent transcriptional regulator [Desulfobacteraceae bacterium]|jgi:two-component system response regulator HydG